MLVHHQLVSIFVIFVLVHFYFCVGCMLSFLSQPYNAHPLHPCCNFPRSSHASTPMLQHPKLQLPKLHLLAFIHIHCTSLNPATLFTYFPLPIAHCPHYCTLKPPPILKHSSNSQIHNHHSAITTALPICTIIVCPYNSIPPPI